MPGRPAVLVVILLVACTPGAPSPEGQFAEPMVADLIRGCDTAVFGDPNLKNAFTFGALTLVGKPQAESDRVFHPSHGRYQAIKLLVVVNGTRDVTVSVPPSERGHVRLLYDPLARANKYGYLFSDGEVRVTFRSCSSRDTQYNGGLLAKRSGCVRLDVEAPERTTAWVPLGAGTRCPS